ncbi:MAG: PKD domain-containing protein [Bacteroidota bacterium]|nr:PKD domain-containing protein [Bacteroidota bacterium]
MGRIFTIISLLTLSAVRLPAQHGGSIPLQFVENKGQWGAGIRYRAEMSTGSFYLGKKGFTVLLHDTTDLKRITAFRHGEQQRGMAPGGILHSHAYRVSFQGANEQPEIVADQPLDTYNNYFIGKDPAKWGAHCRVYQGITYKNIYDGIDLRYYTENGGLKYDLIVHPGADPNRIALKYEGQSKLILKKNQVTVQTTVGSVKEWIPRSYQVGQTDRRDVDCKYTISSDNTIKFRIRNYSPDATLVIDPTLVFCSFTGSRSDNWGYTATYDNAGNFYAGGIVLNDNNGDASGNGYPASPGAFQGSFAGGDASEGGPPYEYDVAIFKFNSNGTARVFATYLGGRGDEQPHSMVVDNAGNLIVTGRTSSVDFPSNLPNVGPCEGFDLFVTKFTADGSGLIGSRKIGGEGSDGVNFQPKYVLPLGTRDLRLNYGDDGRSEVILDNANNIYLAGCTQSDSFPVTPGVFQGKSGGKQDGILMKFSPDVSNVLFSSYIGGSDIDAAFVLALDPLTNNIYVAGGTESSNFPGVGKGGSVLFPANQGTTDKVDGWVSVVSNDGTNLINSTYIGTSGTDIVYGIDVDRLGFPYITGTTTGTWPIVNAAFSNPGGKQFIGKMKPDLSGWVYSTAFGKAGFPYPDISITAFLVDRCQNVYVAGWGGGIDISEGYLNSNTTGLPTTASAIRKTSDGADFYFFVLQKDATSQLYGTFFGQINGNLGDHVDGGTSRFDKQGIIYEAICANCAGGAAFPVSTNVVEPQNPVAAFGGCNEAAVKIAFNFAGIAAGLKTNITGRGDTVGCIPLNAIFQDTIRQAKSYIWDFGDGTPPLATTNYLEPHTYTAVGTYKVVLTAIDSNSCNTSDTVSLRITARNDPATLDFSYTKVGPCSSTEYQFTNLSGAPAGKPFGSKSFVWSFGDNSAPITLGPQDTLHTFLAPGTYNVKLSLIDTNYCNYPDDTVKALYIAQNVKAQFTTPASGCAPYNAVIDNTSIAGQKFYWDFGDGTVDSVDRTPPPHLYPTPGPYTIRLRVVDSATCNITDATQFSITVSGAPTAAFTYTPSAPVENTPTTFFNTSTGGVKYIWLFGDGSSETKATLDTVIHQYNRTDTFDACLVTINKFGCPDTACRPVAALVHPLLDVPNAFTPGRFGQNGMVKVVGFGITKMDFRIYNRWGQLVFVSSDPGIGWDGTLKGNLQPMDVYAYTLEAEFFDGTHAHKKGDITLIR